MILKNLAMTILVAGTALAQLRPRVSAVTTFYTQVVPLVIIGEGWSQRIVLTDVDNSNVAAGTVQFYTQAGQPWTVNLTNGEQNSIFAFSLQPGQTVIFETGVQQSPQILGWALIEETTSGVADLFGQTIFRKQRPGLPDFMSSMVLRGQAFQTLTVFFRQHRRQAHGHGDTDVSGLHLFMRHPHPSSGYRPRAFRKCRESEDHQPTARCPVLDGSWH